MRRFIWAAVLGLGTGCSEAPVSGAPGEPEPIAVRGPVVLVTLDTTRADRIGGYGYSEAVTPNLDALASRGTRFDRAITPTPLTIPAHASLFTGLYPPHHGVRDNGDTRLSLGAVTLAEALQQAGWRTHAAVAAFVTQAHWGFGQGFDAYDDALGIASDRLGWKAERAADAVVDDGLAALEEGAEFLWLHLFDAHAPYRAHADFPGEPYDSEIAWMDAQLGRLFEALPETAWVVVVGDHGESLGDGGEKEHGLLLHDPTLQVPLIVAGPGVPVGVESRAVSVVDVMPTVLRWAGAAVPEGLDGVDLFAESARGGVYSETLYGHHHYGWTALSSVTTESGRIVRGAYDRTQGSVDALGLALLDEAAAWTPRWDAAPASLDTAQVEQLLALGYLAAPEAPVEQTSGVDPRDGISNLTAMRMAPGTPLSERIATLRSVIQRTPEMRNAHVRLGALLAKTGQVQEAISSVVTAYGLRPESTAALTAGGLWQLVGDHREALHWFREALTHDPRSIAARAGEAETLIATGNAQEASVRLDEALSIAPDHPRLVLARALLSLRDGDDLERWALELEQIAGERPYQPGLFSVAAQFRSVLGEPERAQALLRDELAWRPGNLPARLALAESYRSMGRHVDEMKALRPLVNLQPDEPRWHALTARAYLSMNRPDLAAPHLAKCAGHSDCPTP